MKKQKVLRKKFQKETGAGLIEYALLVALIAVVSISGAQTFFTSVTDNMFQSELAIENAIGRTGPCNPLITTC